MERPKFEPIFSKKNEFCEKSSSQPVKTFVPHQAMQLSELMRRFESGQRLNVHENFAPLSNMTRDKIYEESFEDAPPEDVHDVVDVHNYYEQHKQAVHEYRKKQKEAQQAQQAQKAQQAKQEPAKVDGNLSE